MTQEQKPDYELYGPEWERELMKHTKGSLINLYRSACVHIKKDYAELESERQKVKELVEGLRRMSSDYLSTVREFYKSVKNPYTEENLTDGLWTYNDAQHLLSLYGEGE